MHVFGTEYDVYFQRKCRLPFCPYGPMLMITKKIVKNQKFKILKKQNRCFEIWWTGSFPKIWQNSLDGLRTTDGRTMDARVTTVALLCAVAQSRAKSPDGF